MTLASPTLLHLALGAAIGVAAGAAYFAALRRNVRLYIGGGRTSTALALHLLRLLGAGVLFFELAKLGPAVLVGGLCGFVLMRSVATRRGATA